MTRWSEERGSLPLALLAVIVVTGLMIVVINTALTGQRHTRFDQSHEQALQIAEVGLDRMTHLAQRGVVDDGAVLDGSVSGGDYVVELEVDGDGVWTVTATGESDDGPSRTVERVLEPEPLFDVAAFGRFFADFNGGNAADSYRSGEFLADGSFQQDSTGSHICDRNSGSRMTDTGSGHSDVVMCHPTGVGVVATNGELELKGNAFDMADAAEVHYAKEEWIDDARDGATGDCLMSQWRCEDDKVSYFRDPIGLDHVEIPDDVASEGSFPEDVGGNTLPPGEHHFGDVTLDEDTVVQGTPDDPTILYVTGELSVPNHHAVNFEDSSHDGHPQPSPPGSLLIFSQSDGSQALSFGNHASVSAAIYAPEGGFSGGAQGNIYGSLIAGSINNNGGWNFHYDEALADMDDFAPLVPMRWTERR